MSVWGKCLLPLDCPLSGACCWRAWPFLLVCATAPMFQISCLCGFGPGPGPGYVPLVSLSLCTCTVCLYSAWSSISFTAAWTHSHHLACQVGRLVASVYSQSEPDSITSQFYDIFVISWRRHTWSCCLEGQKPLPGGTGGAY